MNAPPTPKPEGLAPIRVALETAINVFLWTFLGAIIATGSVYPPTIGALYGPGLVSVLAGTSAYAAARHIALPMLRPNP